MLRCVNCFELINNENSACPHCGYIKGTPPKELYHLFPGTELDGRYIIGEVLGFGGFGITYKAWDKKLEYVVAVKEFYPSGIVNRTPGTKELVIYAQKRQKEFYYGKDRFLEEARNMAKFNSEPNIVNVSAFFEENNTAYIVMEFLDGISLSQYLQDNEGIIDIDSGIQIAEAIAGALIKIHEKGIIHRDVSPDNIFLCGNGAIKLIDFGAARFSQDENKLMTIILKPGFAPPEQYEKINEQGPWTDVYALGATLYYIITGEKPEESTNRKINDVLPYPHELNPDIPEYISNSIMKAMAIDLHLRFSSVNQFLDGIHQEKEVLPVAVEKKRRKTKRAVGIVSVATVLAVGISIAYFNMKNNIEEETLPDATIVMWYCKSGDDEADEAEKISYEAIIEDFNSSFPNVKIELEGFDEEEYVTKLKEGKQPNLYEYIDEDSSAKHLSLKPIFESETANQCMVLDNVKQCYGNYDYLPLGYNVPVVFSNTVLFDYDGESINEISDVIVDSDVEYSFICDYDYSDFISGTEAFYNENAGDIFYKEEQAVFYGTTTKNYFTVIDKLPAQCKLLFCDTDKVNCVYSDVWTANDIDKNENKATLRLLEFMLNNNAQDVIHVRRRSNSLPVNDAVLDVLASVYNDFDGVFENKDKYVFKKQVQK